MERTKITGHKPRYNDTEQPKITANDLPLSQFSRLLPNDWAPRNNDKSIATHHSATHGVLHKQRNRTSSWKKSFGSPVEVNSGLNLR